MLSGETAETGFRQIDHTADLALEIWAPDEESLLEAGARAVVSVLTEGEKVGGGWQRLVELECLDPEDRLVCWLNEILVLALMEGFLFASSRIDLAETGLRAVVVGEENGFEKVKSELKSVTYHDLMLRQDGNGFMARVVIDV